MYGVGQPQVPPKPDPTLASTELGVDHKHTSRFSEAGFESVSSPHPTGTVVYSDAGTSGAQEAGSRAVYEMHCTSSPLPNYLVRILTGLSSRTNVRPHRAPNRAQLQPSRRRLSSSNRHE